ncbi:hypothetical protein ACVZHT_16260, partial [Vibrio diabolicus]
MPFPAPLHFWWPVPQVDLWLSRQQFEGLMRSRPASVTTMRPLLTCFFAWIFPLYVLTTLLYHVFQISKLN